MAVFLLLTQTSFCNHSHRQVSFSKVSDYQASSGSNLEAWNKLYGLDGRRQAAGELECGTFISLAASSFTRLTISSPKSSSAWCLYVRQSCHISLSFTRVIIRVMVQPQSLNILTDVMEKIRGRPSISTNAPHHMDTLSQAHRAGTLPYHWRPAPPRTFSR